MRFIILLLFVTLSLNAQNKKEIIEKSDFKYTVEGMTDYTVIEIDSLNTEQLYKKSINFIKETYKNQFEYCVNIRLFKFLKYCFEVLNHHLLI